MAYRRSNIFYFDNVTSTGVEKIPVNSTILVVSTGTELIKVSNDNLTEETTVSEAQALGSVSEVKNFDLELVLPTVQIVAPLQGYKGIELQATVVNYDPSQEYSWGMSKGTVLSFNNETGIVTFMLDEGETGAAIISVYTSKPGYPNSSLVSKSINIVEYEEDTTWALQDTPEAEQATLISTTVGNFQAPQVVENFAVNPATGFTSENELIVQTEPTADTISSVMEIVDGDDLIVEGTDIVAANVNYFTPDTKDYTVTVPAQDHTGTWDVGYNGGAPTPVTVVDNAFEATLPGIVDTALIDVRYHRDAVLTQTSENAPSASYFSYNSSYIDITKWRDEIFKVHVVYNNNTGGVSSKSADVTGLNVGQSVRIYFLNFGSWAGNEFVGGKYMVEDTPAYIVDVPVSSATTEEPNLYQMDVSSITNGATPTAVFRKQYDMETETFVNDAPIVKVDTIVKGVISPAAVLDIHDNTVGSELKTENDITANTKVIVNGTLAATLGEVFQVQNIGDNTLGTEVSIPSAYTTYIMSAVTNNDDETLFMSHIGKFAKIDKNMNIISDIQVNLSHDYASAMVKTETENMRLFYGVGSHPYRFIGTAVVDSVGNVVEPSVKLDDCEGLYLSQALALTNGNYLVMYINNSVGFMGFVIYTQNMSVVAGPIRLADYANISDVVALPNGGFVIAQNFNQVDSLVKYSSTGVLEGSYDMPNHTSTEIDLSEDGTTLVLVTDLVNSNNTVNNDVTIKTVSVANMTLISSAVIKVVNHIYALEITSLKNGNFVVALTYGGIADGNNLEYFIINSGTLAVEHSAKIVTDSLNTTYIKTMSKLSDESVLIGYKDDSSVFRAVKLNTYDYELNAATVAGIPAETVMNSMSIAPDITLLVSVDNGVENFVTLPVTDVALANDIVTSTHQLLGVNGSNIKYKFSTTKELDNIYHIETLLGV